MSKQHVDWNHIDTVLLDMDGTLLDLNYDNHFWLDYVPACYAAKHELSDEAAHEKLMAKYSEVHGSLDWYCIDFWTRELGLDIVELKREIADKISIRPEVEKFLCWLNEHDKRVVLVTNAHPGSLNLKMEQTRLHVHFDRLVDSHSLGLAKEQEGFWEKLHEVEPYDPASTVLIDDNLSVLECAERYGIAYCFGILQPDSKKDAMDSDRYHLIDRFSDVLP